MPQCLKPWLSAPTRRCQAQRAAGRSACLAHLDKASRHDFIEAVSATPSLPSGLLRDLEIDQSVWLELVPLLTRYSPINFDGSEFFDVLPMGVHYTGQVSFSHCYFHGRAWFDDSVFPDIAYFVDAKFEEDVSFRGVEFKGEARFDEAVFFSYVRLGGFRANPWFDRATFSSWLSIGLDKNVVARFDGAKASTIIISGPQPEERGCSSPDPAVGLFRATQFSEPAIIRANGAVDISLAGIDLRTPLSLRAENRFVTSRDRLRLLSLRGAVLQAPLLVGDGVDLGTCRMSHATGLDQLRILGPDPQWRTFHRRPVVADELETIRNQLPEHFPAAQADSGGEGSTSVETNTGTLEKVYRQLRVALETSKAYWSASDFYYNEMEMRRLGASRISLDRGLLFAYKLTAGYGVRASRALATYFVILLASGAALRYRTGWFVADPASVAASPGLRFTQYWDSVAVAARNSVSFFGGISTGLTAGGTVLMFVLRLAGPAAFALVILGLRSRVQR